MATLPPWIPNPTEVVSGGAQGVDRLGEEWAKLNSIPVKVYPADWERHGKAAGPIRNAEMSIYAGGLIAFWDGVSKGTAHMIDMMRDRKKLAYVVRTDIPWCKEFNHGVPILNNVTVYYENT